MADALFVTFPARLAWSGLNFVSAHISGASAAIETLDHLTHWRWNETIESGWNGGVGYVSDLTTAAGLAVGLIRPVAPEALGLSEQDWNVLWSCQMAIAALKTYACQECSKRVDWDNDDIEAFRNAARVLTVASALSYADEAAAQDKMGEDSNNSSNGWSVKLVEYQKAQAMLLMAIDRKKETPVVILAFRGTELPDDDLRREFSPDWRRNLQFTLVESEQGKVAEGFLEAWNGLMPQVLEEINKYSRENGNDFPVDLFVTGHSQGGALASVSLMDLLACQSTHYTVRGCLTVAQPRIGDEIQAELLREAVDNADIPLDLVANEDVTGVDPVVSLGGVETAVVFGKSVSTRRPQVLLLWRSTRRLSRHRFLLLPVVSSCPDLCTGQEAALDT